MSRARSRRATHRPVDPISRKWEACGATSRVSIHVLWTRWWVVRLMSRLVLHVSRDSGFGKDRGSDLRGTVASDGSQLHNELSLLLPPNAGQTRITLAHRRVPLSRSRRPYPLPSPVTRQCVSGPLNLYREVHIRMQKSAARPCATLQTESSPGKTPACASIAAHVCSGARIRARGGIGSPQRWLVPVGLTFLRRRSGTRKV